MVGVRSQWVEEDGVRSSGWRRQSPEQWVEKAESEAVGRERQSPEQWVEKGESRAVGRLADRIRWVGGVSGKAEKKTESEGRVSR